MDEGWSRLGLPAAPAPAALYRPARQEGDLFWIAGQLPFLDGRLARTGRIGVELTLADGIELAGIAARNCLAALRDADARLDRVRAVNLVVHVASGPDFREQHLVAALDRGDNDDLVLQGFVQQYGATVIAAPTTTGFNRVAWIMPFAVFLAGTLPECFISMSFCNGTGFYNWYTSTPLGVPSPYSRPKVALSLVSILPLPSMSP